MVDGSSDQGGASFLTAGLQSSALINGLFRRKKGKAPANRTIRHDPATARQFCDNSIKTSRYTLLTFIPLNLLEQFVRFCNLFWLCLVLLQAIPAISPVSPVPLAMGLGLIIGLTAIKYAVDDIFRHRSDERVNNQMAKRIAKTKPSFEHVGHLNFII